jgi:hypothetical protein
VEVPLYIAEDEVSPGAFLKNATAFGMGGWWIGGQHMKPNPSFMRDIAAKVPKDAKIILGCQKGLRSLPPPPSPLGSFPSPHNDRIGVKTYPKPSPPGAVLPFFGRSYEVTERDN